MYICIYVYVCVYIYIYTLAYAVYIVPVILFVAQLDGLPPNWATVEKAALRNLLPGPASWFTVDAARGLRCLGLPKGFADLSILHRAIQSRVATMEGASQGGLNVIHRARALTEQWTQCTFLARKATWNTWFQAAYLFQLRDAIHHCASKGITKRVLEDELAGHIPRPHTPEMRQSIRRRWQKTVWKRLCPDYLPTVHLFMEKRLGRWPLGIFPRIRAGRAMKVYAALQGYVPCRVLASLLRTHWNGWITARRMQRQGEANANRCCFSCQERDSVEHYAHCQVVAAFAWSHLRLPRPATPQALLADFLVLNRGAPQTHIHELTRQALRIASVYRAHNSWRHNPLATPTTMRDSLAQHLKESVRGHASAIQLLGALFLQGP